MKDQKYIRNFCIIAHIDHGKSTLADRFLEVTQTVQAREMRDQLLDGMDLERERGITIKSHPVRLNYTKDGQEYQFNLIDTPGHVDFRYEVSRALAACEGAVVVVDAAQGVEAQTLANIDMALEQDLTLIPVQNKIDLPGARPEEVTEQLEEVGFGADEVLLASAKMGQGITEILDRVIEKVPPPNGDSAAPLRALIFDSEFNAYLGAVAYVRVVDGSVKKGDKIRLFSSNEEFEVTQVGVFHPERVEVAELTAGGAGYITAAFKDVSNIKIGDTVILAETPAQKPLRGYKEPQPMVFAGLYPVQGDQFGDLRAALDKLRLNDSAITCEPDTSAALGFGFRCGFLGLLHMEIVQERLEREFDLDLITTAPSVEYLVNTTDGNQVKVDNPAHLPPVGSIESIMEPMVEARIYVPKDYVGNVMSLCQDKRGQFHHMDYLTTNRVLVIYNLPLGEIVFDFFDKLKSATKGYASLDYQYKEHVVSKMVKLDILVNEEPVDALSLIVHRDNAYYIGREMVAKLKDLIPRQQFVVPVQAAIGSRVIARETIRSMGKNVTAKCYGGDITRKRKLLEKQKAGKKRMKTVGRVDIPQEAFMTVLSVK